MMTLPQMLTLCGAKISGPQLTIIVVIKLNSEGQLMKPPFTAHRSFK